MTAANAIQCARCVAIDARIALRRLPPHHDAPPVDPCRSASARPAKCSVASFRPFAANVPAEPEVVVDQLGLGRDVGQADVVSDADEELAGVV